MQNRNVGLGEVESSYRCNSGGVLSQSDTRTVAWRRMTSSGNRSQKLCGIIRLKERWGLSWYGRLFVTSLLLLASYAVVLYVNSFLVVTHRDDETVHVVVGLMSGLTI